MSIELEVRNQLKALGMTSNLSNDIQSLGLEVTICQFIVVVLSIVSIVFLFTPLFFLKDLRFILFFFGISIASLLFGIWFWIKKADICEHPEEYDL